MGIKPQEDWDNSGLQIGDLCNDINNVMLTLDISSEVVDYAVSCNTDLIITHHPLLFSSLKSIDYSTYEGKIIKKLIANNINLYSMHTSFDMADLGVNHKLAEKLMIENYDLLHAVDKDCGYGGIGTVEPENVVEYARKVKDLLKAEYLRLYCGDEKRLISRVAFCGGSGSDFIQDAVNKGADVYITGDIKYHQAQAALQNNLCIIDAGHYYTEYHSLENIKNILDKNKKLNLNVVLLEKNTVKELII